MASTAVITIAHGRHDHLRRQHRSLANGTVRPDHFVVVAMSDPALAGWEPEQTSGLIPQVVSLDVEDALPLARARNVGARVAVERGARTLIFLDVDCLVGPELVAAYDQVVQLHPDTIWSGPVTYLPAGLDDAQLVRAWRYDAPHVARPAPAPGQLWHDADPDLFWSLSFACDRGVWQSSGGFCEEYAGYGAEDTDFAHHAASVGVTFGWVGSARAYHQHHPTSSPPTEHLDDILRNATLFHRRWGRWPMLGWLEEFERLGLVESDADGWIKC